MNENITGLIDSIEEALEDVNLAMTITKKCLTDAQELLDELCERVGERKRFQVVGK